MDWPATGPIAAAPIAATIYLLFIYWSGTGWTPPLLPPPPFWQPLLLFYCQGQVAPPGGADLFMGRRLLTPALKGSPQAGCNSSLPLWLPRNRNTRTHSSSTGENIVPPAQSKTNPRVAPGLPLPPAILFAVARVGGTCCSPNGKVTGQRWCKWKGRRARLELLIPSLLPLQGVPVHF